MNKDRLDQKLQSMPKVKLEEHKKRKMLQNILERDESEEQLGDSRIKGWFISVGGTLAVALLAMVIFVMPSGPFGGAAFLAEEELRGIEELEKFDHVLKFPTYAPFEIGEIEYDELYWGDREPKDGQVHYVQGDDPDYLTPGINYFSEEEPRYQLTVYLDDQHMQLSEKDDFEAVTLNGDIEARYDQREFVQELLWQEGEVVFNIAIRSDEGDLLPKEEIIKIAESFEIFEF
ncbi:hypothetical protein [Alkalibacillus aidingensis]|uniref:hypothetical protein n=1 Tax=Alkalibacillus aidingensis TaxID=2747607 RepID=UPI0016601DB7|nr:hypothetical protein [Alkalibacillus aidingensis]